MKGGFFKTSLPAELFYNRLDNGLDKMSKKTTETKAQFARRMGVSRQRVSQWAADGLPLNDDGRVKIAPGLRWIKNRIPQIARFRDRGVHLVADSSDGCGAAPPQDAPVQPEASPDAGNLYIRARAAKMTQDARRAEIEVKRAQLELDARQGVLISADEVGVAAFNRARIVRDAMLNIPDRIAPLLVGEDDEKRIHEILATEIRMALAELTGGPTAGEVDDAPGG